MGLCVPLVEIRSEPFQCAPDLDLRLDVHRALSLLPALMRRIVVIVADSGPAEASRITGTSRAAIYRTIAKARTVFAEAGLRPVRQFKRRSAVTPRKAAPTEEASLAAQVLHAQGRCPGCDAQVVVRCQGARA